MHLTAPTTLYTVTTVMDGNCRAVQTTITPTEYDPQYFPILPMNTQLVPYSNGCVARIEYYDNFNNMIRALRGEEIKRHRIAHALIGFIEALTGIG